MFTQMEGIVLIIKFLAVDGGLWGYEALMNGQIIRKAELPA